MVRRSVLSPQGLTRQRVLTAAVDLIDADGLAALTMRRLGQVLGVEGMALYHWVTGRDDLLDGVVQVLTADISTVVLPAGSTNWRHYLRSLAAGFRTLLDTHPAAFPLLLTHPVSSEWWLRAPLRDPAWQQAFIDTLRRCGFDAAAASTAYRMFTSFIAGHLWLESASITAHPLHDDRTASQRRAAEARSDFESSFAAVTDRLALLVRRIPSQRSVGSTSLPLSG